MKTVIITNLDIHSLSDSNINYLKEARTDVAVTCNHGLHEKNSVIFMWDDKKYVEEKETWDEYLNPRPADRIADVIADLIDNERCAEDLSNMIHQMRMSQTLVFDSESYMYI